MHNNKTRPKKRIWRYFNLLLVVAALCFVIMLTAGFIVDWIQDPYDFEVDIRFFLFIVAIQLVWWYTSIYAIYCSIKGLIKRSEG
jgi:hypothetical protein